MPLARAGAYLDLASAGEAISAHAQSRSTRSAEPFAAPLALLGGACALLGAVGWADPSNPSPVDLDLGEHQPALVEALLAQLGVEQDFASQGPGARPDPVLASERVSRISELIASVEGREAQ